MEPEKKKSIRRAIREFLLEPLGAMAAAFVIGRIENFPKISLGNFVQLAVIVECVWAFMWGVVLDLGAPALSRRLGPLLLGVAFFVGLAGALPGSVGWMLTGKILLLYCLVFIASAILGSWAWKSRSLNW